MTTPCAVNVPHDCDQPPIVRLYGPRDHVEPLHKAYRWVGGMQHWWRGLPLCLDHTVDFMRHGWGPRPKEWGPQPRGRWRPEETS